MNEAIKTLIYVGMAVAVALLAAFTYPKQEDFVLPDLVGKSLFAEFTDPDDAAQLQILKFREDLGDLTEFEVARDPETGLWVIPSSSDYPADAETQMRDAAIALIDLQVLGVASDSANEHETYGVVAPKKQMDRSQQGVGLLVTVKNAKDKDLAKIIIGKRVRGTDNQHFVRKPGIDSVYVVKIDPDKFPTDFEKWIERDLLKINTLDVERVTLKDYSIITQQTLVGPRGTIDRRFEADVIWDTDQNKWVLNQLLQFRNGKPRPTELLPTEEMNTEKLNELKSALGDMKIVGVMRKPTGLGADLKAGTEIANNQESLLSLTNRGFYLASVAGSEPELHAANGELVIGLKDGVQYLLRFGEIADVQQESEEGKLSRYLFVSARLNESEFPPLQLEPLPGGEDADKTEAKEDAKDEANKTDEVKKEDKKDGGAADEKSDLELKQERIRKENQRKKDEREEQLKKANQKVAELNARFADWYYIISEDEYKKVHLGRNDLIKESANAKEEGFGLDSFRQLEQEGIKKPEPAPPAPGMGGMPPGMQGMPPGMRGLPPGMGR